MTRLFFILRVLGVLCKSGLRWAVGHYQIIVPEQQFSQLTGSLEIELGLKPIPYTPPPREGIQWHYYPAYSLANLFLGGLVAGYEREADGPRPLTLGESFYVSSQDAEALLVFLAAELGGEILRSQHNPRIVGMVQTHTDDAPYRVTVLHEPWKPAEVSDRT